MVPGLKRDVGEKARGGVDRSFWDLELLRDYVDGCCRVVVVVVVPVNWRGV